MPLKGNTTHVVILFIEPASNKRKKKLDVELVPVSWLSEDEKGSWTCRYPSEEDYHNVENWSKKSKAPRSHWEASKVRILKEADDYAQGLRRLGRSFAQSNIGTTSSGENISDQSSKRQPVILNDNDKMAELNSSMPLFHTDASLSTTKPDNLNDEEVYRRKKHQDSDQGKKSRRQKPDDLSDGEGSQRKNTGNSDQERESRRKKADDLNDEEGSQRKNHANFEQEKRFQRKKPDDLTDGEGSRTDKPSDSDNEADSHGNELDDSDEEIKSSESDTSTAEYLNQKRKRKLERRSNHSKRLKNRGVELSSSDRSDHGTSKTKNRKALASDTSTSKKSSIPPINTLEDLGSFLNSKFKEFEEKMTRDIVEKVTKAVSKAKRSLQVDLKSSSKEIKGTIALTNTNILGTSSSEGQKELAVELPIKNENEFEEFDKSGLVGAKEKALKSAMTMAVYGATTPRDAVSKILKLMISKSVQEMYSGCGRAIRKKDTEEKVGKKGFNKTNTFRCMRDVITEKLKCSAEDVQTATSRWLSGAGDRDGERKRPNNPL